MQKKFKSIRKNAAAAHQRRKRKLKLLSRHPIVVPVITFLCLLLITFGAFWFFDRGHVQASDAQIVIISHDGIEQTVPSREPTVGALLSKLNIKLNNGDVVEPSAGTVINQDDYRINVYRALPVEVIDGAHKTYTFSAATTSRSIALQTGAKIYPEDEMDITPATNFLADGAIGEQVTIKRSIPITINLYGQKIPVRTLSKTVGDLLAEKNIHLAKGDSVAPTANSSLVANQKVYIIRKGTKVTTVARSIPPPVKTIQDPSLSFGTSAVRQQGSPGKEIATYQLKLKNGKVVGRTLLQTVVVQKAVAQIEVIGTSLSGIKGDMALAGISPSDYNYADYIISHESGWCPTKAQGQYGGCPAYSGSVPSYGGYGLCQATPGIKMSSAGSDWATSPITQLRWCNGYAVSTYGSWAAAYSHWLYARSW